MCLGPLGLKDDGDRKETQVSKVSLVSLDHQDLKDQGVILDQWGQSDHLDKMEIRAIKVYLVNEELKEIMDHKDRQDQEDHRVQ